MLSEIAQLLELQSIDAKIVELSFQVKRFDAHRKELEAKIAEARATVEETRAALKQFEHESRMMNLDVDELDANIRDYQVRLDTGIISFKEMEDLRAKITSERNRMNTMEDEALAMMDQIEAARVGLAEAEEGLRAREAELNHAIAENDEHRAATQADLDAAQAERGTLSEGIAPYLVGQYKTLHARFGDPVATINHGTCSGCKLKVSGSTIERARGGLGIVTCEHCSRILYIE